MYLSVDYYDGAHAHTSSADAVLAEAVSAAPSPLDDGAHAHTADADLLLLLPLLMVLMLLLLLLSLC